jgi:hypothetical protein
LVDSNSRAVGTVTVVEVDPAGNYCASKGDAVLAGWPFVTPPPITPVAELKAVGIGGGCFITSLR